MSRLLAPAEVDDAIAYGFAKLAHTPSEQLQAEAEAHRVRKGLPPSQLPAELDAVLYGLAKLINGTPLGQLRDEADAHRAMTTGVGAVPVRDQLAHLDRLVWIHEDYWSSLAQHNPRSTVLREFFKRHWDPWYGNWMLGRPQLDRQRVVYEQGYPRTEAVPASEATLMAFVKEAARGLTSLRELAAYNLIPTPDLGTTQHGFSREEEPLVASVDARAKVSGPTGIAYNASHLGESTMSIEHYRATAIQAVTGTQQHNPSPVYGYFRRGVQQKIYLFPNEQDAIAWYNQQPQVDHAYDYLAVFSAADLRTPIAETLGVHDQVGHWALPFALGLPAGGLAGYHLRKWQEANPGKTFPWISGEDHAGADYVGEEYVGEDYVGEEYVGAEAHPRRAFDLPRRQAWLTARALIQSAISEVREAESMAPAAAYVWSLDPPGASSQPGVELTGTTLILPFASYNEALDYVRSRHATPYVAMAVFDRERRWPNPVNWTKNPDPSYAPVIAQQIAKHTPPPQVAGEFVAVSGMWDKIKKGVLKYTGTTATNKIIKKFGLEGVVKTAAIGVATAYGGPAAGAAAGALAGPVMNLGIENKAKAEAAQADIQGVTAAAAAQSPEMHQAVNIAKDAIQQTATAYTVAQLTKNAKAGDPAAQKALSKLQAAATAGDADAAMTLQVAKLFHREQEKPSTHAAGVGGEPWQSIVGGEPWQSIVGESWDDDAVGGDIVGQALSVLRRQATVAAEEMPGRAVGVRRGADGRWRLKAFRSTDDADDWFGHAISEPSEFTYAAYFSKDRHGIPFLENEQVGKASRARRALASATVAP